MRKCVRTGRGAGERPGRGEGTDVDLFDGELGGRDEHQVDAGGGCSWFSVVLIGLAILVVIGMNWFFDFVRSLF